MFGFKKKVRVQTADGTIVTAGLVEGAGIYRCNTHNFETESFEKIQKHFNDGTHGKSGQNACELCKTPVTYEYMKREERVLCNNCTEHLKRQLLESNEKK